MTDLVLQGLDVQTPDLRSLAKLTDATEIENVGENAFRLRDARKHPDVPPYCAKARLDHAYVPSNRKLSDFKLLVMDMDSTLITIETVDELADLVGKKKEVAAVTESAMRGEIEYDDSLRKRVAVLKGLEEAALDRLITERLKLSPGAEKMIAGVKKAGMKLLLVSGGFTYVTERLQKRLGIDYVKSNKLGVKDRRLTGELEGKIINADGKRDALIAVRDQLRIYKDQIIAMGDGANDLKFMAEAGVSIAYHAKPVVRERATLAFEHVGLDGVLNLWRHESTL